MVTNTSTLELKASLRDKLEIVIARLGLDSDLGLIRSWEQFDAHTSRHIVRQAFNTINTHAVYGFHKANSDGNFRYSPILYICSAGNDEEAKELHRLVWSQGVVPLLLIATPSSLEIRRSLAPPPEKPITVSWELITENSETLPKELISLTGIALRSSIVWQDFAIDRSSRIDNALLDGIIELSDEVQLLNPQLARSTVHAIIGRFLYLYILQDRKIIDLNWIKQLRDSKGESICPSIASSLATDGGSYSVWPSKEVWFLFDAIDEVMNGSIFPISTTIREEIDENILHLIHRVIRYGDRILGGSRQLSFLDVSFATLRTETVSAIYELFLALESLDRKADDGAFYTPPYLVDYVLDEIDHISPFSKKSRVLDPAAGSGIFLVGAFRRILERTLPSGKWSKSHFKSSRRLLENSIFGIERNSQAANVSRFSLYLTLLDYFQSTNIKTLSKMAGADRVFPPLTENVQSNDVFEIDCDDGVFVKRFTHVVGNPPWGSLSDNSDRTNIKHTQNRVERLKNSMAPAELFHSSLDTKSFPISNKRLSELFIWKIKQDFLASNGALGILVSTRSFIGRNSSSFPNALAKQLSIVGIANLSHFRYRLFAAARSPTTAIFAVNSEPDAMDEVWVYSPLLSSQPIGQKGHLWSILVNSIDVETHRIRDLVRKPDGWFDHMMLRPLDRRYARHLRAWTEHTSKSLGNILSSSGFKMSRGGSPSQTGLPPELLLKANYRNVLGLDGFQLNSYPHNQLAGFQPAGKFEKLFGGNVLLIPRSMNDAVFVEEPIAFSSTFNAIYYDGDVGSSHKNLLAALACYLVSDVARYFYALIGRTWILDRARLEKNDLESIPFPVEGINDSAISVFRSEKQKDISALIANRLGLDSSFQEAVDEYTNFRRGFEDSQLPTHSLIRPSKPEQKRYQEFLKSYLIQLFGSQVEIEIQSHNPSPENLFLQISAQISRRGIRKSRAAQTTNFTAAVANLNQFTPYSAIGYSAKTNQVSILKPLTQVAWTMEQAFTDARAISSEILNSEVPA